MSTRTIHPTTTGLQGRYPDSPRLVAAARLCAASARAARVSSGRHPGHNRGG